MRWPTLLGVSDDLSWLTFAFLFTALDVRMIRSSLLSR